MSIVSYGHVEEDFWRINTKIYVKNKICEYNIDFIIDPGSTGTILSPDIARMIGIKLDNSPNRARTTLIGTGSLNAINIIDVGIIFRLDEGTEDLMIKCPKILVPASNRDWPPNFNLLGQDVLKHFNVFVNNISKEIKFECFDNTCILIPRCDWTS